MAFGIRKFIEGILVKNSVDTTKEVELKVSNSATTATKTTILASQTADVTVTLPDSTSTLATTTQVNGKADLDLNNIDPIAADLIPDGNITRAIGSSAAAWSGVYTSQLTDSSNDASYVVDTRVTYDTSTTVSIDADARLLKSSAGNKIGWSGTDNTTYASIIPNADNTLNLGNTSTKFNTVYASTVASTSSSPSVVLGASAELKDSAGDTSVDWPNRQLQSGATVKLDWSGTDVSLNTRKLTNVVDPTSAQDAATKNYVDNIINSPPTMQTFTTGSGTYTTPANVRYIRVRMVGAGGGGSGTGSGFGTGTSGGVTTFGTALLTANGAAAPTGSQGGAGGTASIASPAYGTATGGGSGQGYTLFQLPTGTDTTIACGGMGGSSFFGGGGGGGGQGSSGQAAIAHGAGGGGAAGETSQTNNASGVGGGAGGFIDAYISSPSASYSYAVGAGGAGGAAGTGGSAGGGGADGYIEVTEFY